MANRRVVWKKVLTFDPDTNQAEAWMPVGAEVLDGQLQDGQYAIWFTCSPSAPNAYRCFQLVPTGEDVPEYGKYVSTFQITSAGYVFHVFEVTR